MGIAEVYAEGRHRITDIARGLSDEEAQTRVPTCPRWSVSDVIAHLTGVCADILAGNIEGVATDPWTDAQVTARKGRSMGELLDEWSELAPRVEAFADQFPGASGSQWVADLTAHEHDIRTAVGRPGARDSRQIDVGLGFLVEGGLAAGIIDGNLDTINVRAGTQEWVAGDGEPKGSLEATPFELFRSLTGRRSARQLRTLDWQDVDVEAYLQLFEFGPFSVPESDIDE